MARSIHVTWSDYYQARRKGASEEKLEEMREQLLTKSRLKRRVKKERQQKVDYLDIPPIPTESIPISIVEQGPHILYSASEQDLRAVIDRLPSGVMNGIDKVILSLGPRRQQENIFGEIGSECDPIFGLPGSRFLPGVWRSPVLGRYITPPPCIQLFATIYEKELPIPEFSEIYLKLLALATFVHEVAHHQDEMMRTAQVRWRSDTIENAEIYAENWQYQWTKEAVIPYLEEVYPQQIQALHHWIKKAIGISIPLIQLAGDPRRTEKGGWLIFFPIHHAFDELVEDLLKGSPHHEMRIRFADSLHYSDFLDQALEVIELVLAEEPGFVAARALKGDILKHLDRDREAESLMCELVEEDGSCCRAWEVLSDIYSDGFRWSALLKVTEIQLKLEQEDWKHHSILQCRARALLGLARFSELKTILAQFSDSPNKRNQIISKSYHWLALLKQDKPEEVLALVEKELLTEKKTDGKRIDFLWKAIVFYARNQLGLEVEALENEEINRLKRLGFSWICSGPE